MMYKKDILLSLPSIQFNSVLLLPVRMAKASERKSQNKIIKKNNEKLSYNMIKWRLKQKDRKIKDRQSYVGRWKLMEIWVTGAAIVRGKYMLRFFSELEE